MTGAAGAAITGAAGAGTSIDEEAAPDGASEMRRKAATAALFASWPPFAISSKKSRCRVAIALAFAFVAAFSSALAVPVGGMLPQRGALSSAACGAPLSTATTPLAAASLCHGASDMLRTRLLLLPPQKQEAAPKSAGRRTRRTRTSCDGRRGKCCTPDSRLVADIRPCSAVVKSFMNCSSQGAAGADRRIFRMLWR